MNSLIIQGYIFLVMLVLGVILGMLYDIYRFLKGRLGWKGRELYLTDGVFWLIVTVVAFCVLLLSNWGQLRVYIFISIFAGLVFYLSILSKLFIKILIKTEQVLCQSWKIIKDFFRVIRNIIGFIIKFFLRVISIIFWPIIFPFRLIYSFVSQKVKSIKLVEKINQKISRRKR
ncbi:spore cortex biosynthesis protein YabQ [Proteinivorax tanatarense]|uniref:Spore cortex biosynthesis protein YabQ n=1 Tax=Proteinivorax tanatarense TaxID=1260629 RepID=A0AAU7VLJ9_9FIRM